MSNGTNKENVDRIGDLLDSNGLNDEQFYGITNEINENTSKTWKWIAKSNLNDDKKYIRIIYQEVLFLITTSFLGIWILMSEIYEIFLKGSIYHDGDSLFEKVVEIFYNIFGIITIIPISIVFIAMRKRSKSLCILFNIASLIEVTIILSRLLWSFCKDFSFYSFYESDDGNTSLIKLGIDNDIMYRERFFIAIPTLIFLVILNINTYLCQKKTNEKFISQIYGLENKLILQDTKEFSKKSFKLFLKFLDNNSESCEHKKISHLSEWKFKPESKILLLNIVSINDEIVSVDNEIGNIVNNENDEKAIDKDNKDIEIVGGNNTSKRNQCVEVHFNAKTDVMIQTNYPLTSIKGILLDAIALSINIDISSQPLSLTPSEELLFLSSQVKYWFYYYEITILSNPNNDKTIIAIGLATKNHSTNRLPGCDTHSVGFHSDEGRIFHNEKYTGSKYAEKWGEVNDVIGCGYVPKTGQVFFTMNGKNMGIAYTGLFYKWYPTIGSNGICGLKVNFGQKEFKYKEANGMSVAGVISQELSSIVNEFTKIDINP
ncbi:hypothetical protein RclHR1_03390005 [Rhizophagus clarus]|uniref:Concanavalin A-like lectin/glucanase domain-containing protein n=1 Tax=Rhizophagus clarus TaxID=94130 RepID=A0A2Z6RPC9_9GLOM|nr:hypothetical protein RclHR1_03390005 [Rhizophagus clarus]GES85167.1 concanavalin A-like lectin/glucanase domain-containing protein [Rhizophagus clarus]